MLFTGGTSPDRMLSGTSRTWTGLQDSLWCPQDTVLRRWDKDAFCHPSEVQKSNLEEGMKAPTSLRPSAEPGAWLPRPTALRTMGSCLSGQRGVRRYLESATFRMIPV